jgi:hypothetical protein
MLNRIHFAALAALLLTASGIAAVNSSTAAEPGTGAEAAAGSAVTFTRDIAPILYANCTACHREGEVAPFPLVTYEDAASRAATIAAVTQTRLMPPWKAESHGEFVGERRLTQREIDRIQRWAHDGAPEGRREDLPELPTFPAGWPLGPPDLEVQPGGDYTLAADGDDVYRCFVIPTSENEERFLSAVDIRPGNRRIVHHVILFLDTTGAARRKEKENRDGQPGYTSFGGPGFPAAGTLGGWVPGSETRLQPDGVGWRLPKGADIVMQVHYSKTGKPELDRTRVGLYFAKAPVARQMRVLPVAAFPLRIPPGETRHEVRAASVPLPRGITVRELWPHMHLLGRDLTLTASLPDGTASTLVKVVDWDFAWQTRYVLREPRKLPRGTTIRLVAHYDNSEENPRNPNSPPKLVTWGEQTTDEMGIGFILYTVDGEDLTRGVTGRDVPWFGRGRDGAGQILATHDHNSDGALDQSELLDMLAFLKEWGAARGREIGPPSQDPPRLAARWLLATSDADRDGRLDARELAALLDRLFARARGEREER